MLIPRVRERVRIICQTGIYLVVGTDQDSQLADLIPLHGSAEGEEGIPFSRLEAFRENLPLEST